MSGRGPAAFVATVVAVAALVGGASTYRYLHRASRPAVETATGAPPMAKLAAVIPEVSLPDRDGQMRSLTKDWRGKSLIVNFWATWCVPCRKEIPLLLRLQHEHADQGFQVVGIAVDFRDKVLQYAQSMKIDYPILIGEQEALDAASAFGVEAVGFPFTVFADARGRIVLAHLGELTPPAADLILGEVADVNAGRKTLEQARNAIETGLKKLPRPGNQS
ncbi:MAG TPA: TlpA disulfide reductase family protein [Steroidobacteraceae bacterium]|nr:TlpA disulfide reductase family protein [Steroidobacteraceae bacterium]